uniref:Uncharacterized protein n=1 Tax=Scophthalmus maximus TaxID=52904 RepID=A0A8D3CTC8_SCOMX
MLLKFETDPNKRLRGVCQSASPSPTNLVLTPCSHIRKYVKIGTHVKNCSPLTQAQRPGAGVAQGLHSAPWKNQQVKSKWLTSGWAELIAPRGFLVVRRRYMSPPNLVLLRKFKGGIIDFLSVVGGAMEPF